MTNLTTTPIFCFQCLRWAQQGSNLRRPACKASALPLSYPPIGDDMQVRQAVKKNDAGWTGLEPAASGVTGRRYNRLNYHPEVLAKQCRRAPY